MQQLLENIQSKANDAIADWMEGNTNSAFDAPLVGLEQPPYIIIYALINMKRLREYQNILQDESIFHKKRT